MRQRKQRRFAKRQICAVVGDRNACVADPAEVRLEVSPEVRHDQIVRKQKLQIILRRDVIGHDALVVINEDAVAVLGADVGNRRQAVQFLHMTDVDALPFQRFGDDFAERVVADRADKRDLAAEPPDIDRDVDRISAGIHDAELVVGIDAAVAGTGNSFHTSLQRVCPPRRAEDCRRLTDRRLMSVCCSGTRCICC